MDIDGRLLFIVTVAAVLIASQVLIAILILAAGFNRPANRALAVALFAGAWTWAFANILQYEAVAPSIGRNWYLYARHAWFIDSLALLPFLANYPTRRPGLPLWATRLWPYLGLALLFGIVQLMWPQLAFGNDGRSGPLVLVDFLVDIAGSIVVPIILLWEVRRGRYEKPLGPIFLVGFLPVYFMSADLVSMLAFAGLPVNQAVASGGNLVAPGAMGAALNVLIGLRFLLGVALLASLGWTALRRPRERWACFAVLAVLLGYCILRVTFAFVSYTSYNLTMGATGTALFLPLDLTALGFLSYVALRDQSVGLNRKIRIGISRAALALVFLGVFFVVAQVAQNYLSDEYGYLTGGIAAGAMLFAVAPLQRAAERLAQVDKAAPDAKTAEVYREAVELTLADRTITAREERHLAHLAERLGLAAGQAMDIRLAVQESQSHASNAKGAR